MNKDSIDSIDQTIANVVSAVDAATEHREPFFHLQLADVFPAELYAAMLETMPVKKDYRPDEKTRNAASIALFGAALPGCYSQVKGRCE